VVTPIWGSCGMALSATAGAPAGRSGASSRGCRHRVPGWALAGASAVGGGRAAWHCRMPALPLSATPRGATMWPASARSSRTTRRWSTPGLGRHHFSEPASPRARGEGPASNSVNQRIERHFSKFSRGGSSVGNRYPSYRSKSSRKSYYLRMAATRMRRVLEHFIQSDQRF
jgi:hypothetical protein